MAKQSLTQRYSNLRNCIGKLWDLLRKTNYAASFLTHSFRFENGILQGANVKDTEMYGLL